MTIRTTLYLCAGVVAIQASPALAQSGESRSDSQSETGVASGEIIVTARKRDETLQSVPVAVSAIGGEALKNNLATDLTKLAELAPQVKIGEGGSGTGAVISIRGISSSSSDASFDQSVLVEVDGVPFSRGSIIGTRLFDISNVQVLSGPQALYFGKNSPAGVISINSADPTRHFEGYVTAGYEFVADQAYGETAVSGPVSDSLSARLAVRASTQQGWITNIAPIVPLIFNPGVNTVGANNGRRLPASDELAARLSLLWEPSETFSAKLKVSVNSVKANSGNGNSEPFCVAPTTVPLTTGNNPIPNGDCEGNRITSHGGVPAEFTQNYRLDANDGVPFSDRIFYFASLELKNSFDDFELVSTTGYYNEDHQIMNTTDWSAYALVWAAARYRYELVTQELRLSSSFDGPMNFMIGGYYEHSRRPFDNAPVILPAVAGRLYTLDPATNNYATLDMTSITKGSYASIFAELSWKILPELELSGGARWSHDRKDMNQVNLAVGPSFLAPGLRPAGSNFYAEYSDTHISPEVTLTWRPNSDITAYAAYKTGYKSGGISNPFLLSPTATAASVIFQPEVAKGFELGFKARFGNFRFDVNAYTYKYDDLQVTQADNTGSVTVFNVRNAASSRVKGIQASADWQATEELRFHGNIGLNSVTPARPQPRAALISIPARPYSTPRAWPEKP
jgi:iron complex outermembrane recepter protein